MAVQIDDVIVASAAAVVQGMAMGGRRIVVRLSLGGLQRTSVGSYVPTAVAQGPCPSPCVAASGGRPTFAGTSVGPAPTCST